MHWACAGGSVHIMHLLWKRGLTNYLEQDNRGYTALHVASQNKHLSLVHYLILRGVDVDNGDHENVTPLHWAAIKGSIEIVRYLHKNGADPCKQDIRGYNALHWAASVGNFSVCSYLASEKSLLKLHKTKNNAGLLPREIALKTKKSIYNLILHSEMQIKNRKLSDSGFKLLWFSIPFFFYAVAIILNLLSVSFLYLILIFSLLSFFMVYVIYPSFTPPKHSNPLTIGIFYSSIIVICFYWFLVIAPLKLQTGSFIEVSLYFILFVSILILHSRLVIDDPGILPKNKIEDANEFYEEIEHGIKPAPICTTCLVRKPIRCKHDSVTNNCIVRFDHYCVWIFNVVGIKNHSRFILMLAMVIFGHIWTLIGLVKYFSMSLPIDWTYSDLWINFQSDYFLDYLIIFQIFNGVWETFLIITQINSIKSNITMNELMNWNNYNWFHKNVDKNQFYNPFDRGTIENLKLFLNQNSNLELYKLYHRPHLTEV